MRVAVYAVLPADSHTMQGLLFGVASWWVGVGANSQLVDRYVGLALMRP